MPYKPAQIARKSLANIKIFYLLTCPKLLHTFLKIKKAPTDVRILPRFFLFWQQGDVLL